MADDNMTLGYLMGQEGSNGGGGNGGMFGSDAIWAIILFAMIFGYGGNGFGGGFGGGGGASGALTRAELYDGFAIQNIDSAVRGVQQGICDSTYALTNSITNGFYNTNMGMMQGFNGVERGFCNLGHQISDCCCQTQRAIDNVNFNMAKGFCDLGNVINMQTRDIIDNQNANYRGLMDFLVSEKLASKDARIAELSNQLSQSNQNAVIRAAIDASTAEIIRRTGNDCPVPSYLVQPPTPVNFPINGCGTVQFGGTGYGGYGNSCGCGCG